MKLEIDWQEKREYWMFFKIKKKREINKKVRKRKSEIEKRSKVKEKRYKAKKRNRERGTRLIR